MPSTDEALLAVALGSNRPSAFGDPRDTFLAVRPVLEADLAAWADQPLRCLSLIHI